MIQLKKYGVWVIIGVLVVLLVVQRGCRFDRLSDQVRIEKSTEVIHDSVPKIVKVGVPVPYKVVVPWDTVYPVLDSTELSNAYNAIRKEFFSKNIYGDTLMNDSSALIIVQDTVFKNKLLQRELYFRNRRATVINNTNVIQEDKRFKMYIGLGVGASTSLSDQRFSLSPELLFVTSESSVTGLRYDLINKIVSVGFYWKITLKRKK